MLHINLDDYGPACAGLITETSICLLGPGQPNQSAHSALENLDIPAVTCGRPVHDQDMARCCISALWLRHNYLDTSHAISQQIGSASGSYWHGIMHRREPDYSNAKYWFRRVGQHPIFERLHKVVQKELDKPSAHKELNRLWQHAAWDPFLYIDLCKSAAGSGQPLEEPCRRVADIEWQLLFDYCYRQAVGKGHD